MFIPTDLYASDPLNSTGISNYYPVKKFICFISNKHTFKFFKRTQVSCVHALFLSYY
jgi:hypothetical protein